MYLLSHSNKIKGNFWPNIYGVELFENIIKIKIKSLNS